VILILVVLEFVQKVVRCRSRCLFHKLPVNYRRGDGRIMTGA
jgi:hypothetical protein